MVATLHQERMSSIDVLSWVVLAQAGHRVPGIASALLLVTLPCGPSKFDGVGYHARGTWWGELQWPHWADASPLPT